MTTRSSVKAWLLVPTVACLVAVSGCPGGKRQADIVPAESTTARAVARPPAPREEPAVEWELTSTAFAHGERIPVKYTADGENVSPPLEWTAPPKGTAELVLICDDPDAPGGTWNHWIVYGLVPDATGLPENAAGAEPAFKLGVTSFGDTGYGGPAPPSGTHRYQFTIYALSEAIGLAPGASKDQVLAAMEGKVLAQTMLEGTYSRYHIET